MRLTKSIIGMTLACASMAILADKPVNSTIVNNDLTMNKIMADPDWMGNAPNNPRWSHDGQSIIYSQKVVGHTHRQDFKLQLGAQSIEAIPVEQALWTASQSAAKSTDKSQGVFIYQGDVYWTNYQTGEIKALTADEESQSRAQFIDNDKVSYFEGRKVFVYDLASKLSTQIAEFKTQVDPNKEKKKSYLEQSQPRLFQYIDKKQKEDKFQKERREKNKLSKNKTFYLGSGIEISTFRLSPDANWMVVGTIKAKLSGEADHMPEFVTGSGYVNDRKVRPLVGTSKPRNETFYLFDLVNHKRYPIDTANLPGINDDPLEDLKQSSAKKIGYKYQELQGPRAVYAYNWRANGGVEWTRDSRKFSILLYSYDNKDRWLVGMDTKDQKSKTLHWMSDEAWINDWTFNEFGWLPDNQTAYYLSEEDGYSHIYIKKGKRKARQLTEGKWEVSDLTISQDGQNIYFKANKKHPGIYEIYRVSTKGGKIEALTDLGGVNDYVLSPKEDRLVIRHSTTTQLPELFLVNIADKQAPVKLTNTSSEAFKAIEWNKPEIVEVPSSKIKRNIYSRFYQAETNARDGEDKKKPAVIFVHGAGYLQNAHQGWSGYFREFMFHNLLTRQGYVVLDMDFRASKGYGRDWRTAIYRQMGTPELEDLVDGANWLVENHNVDPKRIGIYGGSYGGFMTFMALFKEPEVFAAGASLRPVTDWAHYNHGYTSNILNTPEVDPEAYERSSPIEFADGLNKPLLIAHGMVDDNVFFKDSVRLVQRLIELEKTRYFETAIYPVEPHGFREPSSWLDEYTRIHLLFERHLNP
ncbi:S9 family peptidase [Aliikangiella marina]|uniref:S9 family peptidase n=1 Tax=Aliikangiella marina TaxID=1712262 RepID=A0A545TD24_9GAMM|nr:prolyl oligopeptidase family serine peptidase [Aliikangiella marina]TQV75076.1 S9 family peptidase [Aliikangiella marina]